MSEILDLMKLSEEKYTFYVNKIHWFDNNLCLQPLSKTMDHIEHTIDDLWFDSNTLLVHNLDKPAMCCNFDGIKIWIVQGKRHNLYGPACTGVIFTDIYCINGKKLSKKEWEIERLKEIYCINHPELKPFL